MYTNAQTIVAFDTIKQLDDCNPISTDISSEATSELCKALGKDKEFCARQIIEKGANELVRPWCIVALKSAARLICGCSPSVICEATDNLLGCP